MRLAFLPVLFALLLAGCGVKGPLYLPANKLPPPEKKSEAPVAPKPAAPQEKAQ